jgi:hypothetical protein
MRDADLDTVGIPLAEEIFRLNLAYLLLAQRLLAQDEKQAQVLLGVEEPLAAWLREADTGAIVALARSPVAVHAMRLPKHAASTLLAACTEGRWLGPIHVAMAAIEATRGRAG